MKLSLNWLNDFLNLDGISPEDLAKKLTMGSFEVEEILEVGPALKGPILVGKILDIQKHPNADKLSVTKITTDGNNELQIVCGAKNIQTGQKIPVSLIGAEVVNRQDGSKLVIKKAKIRDIESSGMLCAPSELGINSEEESGILILPEDAPIGEDIINYLCLQKDTVLEVAARSNRGDALSIYGLSKEVSALTGKKVKDISFKEPISNNNLESITPKIENSEDTFVFYTTVIENVLVKESPNWLKKLLNAAGLRSINNIVDITNYISFTYGQPMHAYDKSKLNGKSLSSRFSKNGEKIITLDGKERELKEGILVIADEKEPVAIAGVMGGKNSEVSETTKSIVFEAAVFSPFRVRRGSRAVGLTSEASKRFERGVDSNFTHKALLKAIELTYEIAKPKDSEIAVGKISKAGEPVKKDVKIKLTTIEIKRILDIDIKVEKVKEILEPLEFISNVVSENTLEVIVPPHRTNDISRQIDLIEEVARLYGYDNIPPIPPPSTLSAEKLSTSLEKIRNFFLGAGFSETYLSSLIGEQVINMKGFKFDKDNSVAMLNPLSVEHSILRQSLIPGLLEALKLNQSHQIQFIKLFEIGKTYFAKKSQKPNEKETATFEIRNISGVVYGEKESWLSSKTKNSQSKEEVIFFTIKGFIESFFSQNHLSISFEKAEKEFLHPNFNLKIVLNKGKEKEDIGVFGCLHPSIEKKLEIHGPVTVFEINLESLIKELSKQKTFKRISSMPIVERDITIDLPTTYKASDITNSLKEITSNFVIELNIISIYELDKESRSLTYRLKMQDFEQTLTTKLIDDEVNKIKNHLSSTFEAKFRG